MSEPSQRVFGASVLRKEDARLLRGDGRYIADLKLHGAATGVFVRSPHAHARILGIDASRALADPRVLAVVAADDLPPGLPPLPCIDAEHTTRPFNQPVLAKDKVRYVGEPVALVVVDADRYEAEDVAGLVEVDWEPLAAVAHADAALEAGAPIVHEDTNVADVLEYRIGDPAAALAAAPHTLLERFVTQRYAGTPMETRGVIAEWDERREALTIWSSTQVPHGVKRTLAPYLDLPEHAIRVVAPDVGGAFGVKLQSYPEEVVLALAALRVRRPIRWIEDRYEHFVATTHGREQWHDVEVGFDGEGRILAVRDHAVTNTGAYLQRLTLVEPFIGVAMLSGPYRIEHQELTSTVVMTNTTPLNPFRGVGHVQAAFVMERVVDLVAEALALDAGEVRRRNMIRPDELPLRRGIGNVLAGEIVYDSGDYPACLERALELAGWHGFRKRQAVARGEGRYLGMGIGCFVEEVSLGPYESAHVRVEPSGSVVVGTGACSSGQGHATVFAQIVADELEVPLDRITVVHGDTDLIPTGVGTYASRSAAVGGTAVRNAAADVRRKATRAAAGMLEVAEADVEFGAGSIRVKGSPQRAVALAEIAGRLQPGQPLPPAVEGYGLEAAAIFHPPSNSFAYGVHVSTVDVDVATGEVRLLRHVVVNDSGTLINPLLVDGQVQGGVALGIGGALLEEIAYDGDGQPRNPTFMDYLVPAVGNMPEMLVEHLCVPTPLNPDGTKGVGEGGAVGSPAAIANAVHDALRPFGIRVTATPLGPAQVWRLLADAGAYAS